MIWRRNQTGDQRVNEFIGLTNMNQIWMREHNRVTDFFIKLNDHWSDERLYQETRRIVIAEMQHVVYNEFVPLLIGTYRLQAKPYKCTAIRKPPSAFVPLRILCTQVRSWPSRWSWARWRKVTFTDTMTPSMPEWPIRSLQPLSGSITAWSRCVTW